MHVDRLTVIYLVALVAAVILHEISHGVVALWLGDDTAKRAGRLTLNPVPHIDPFGSVVMPVLIALTHLPGIAWAKPVPVNPGRLRNGRRDMVFVALAGPATNLALAVAAAFVARSQFHANGAAFVVIASLPLRVLLPLTFALVNLFLAVFNFLPIPPLDGASLVDRALPPRWLPGWRRFQPYGILVLFLLVFETNVLGHLLSPFTDHLYRFVLR